MMVVVLVVPPSRTYTQRLPIGIMQISSCLDKFGIENKIVDIKDSEYAYQKTLQSIHDEAPDVLGITCCATEVFEVRQICNQAKAWFPDLKIVLGGPHPTNSPDDFTDVNYDFIIQGEGEISLPELIKDINKGKLPPKIIKGIAIGDLDTLPYPSYDKINLEYYASPSVWAIRPIYLSSLQIFGSRGCPYSCKFCVAHTIFGKKVRRCSPEYAIEHIEYLKYRYKIDAVYFGDESFTLNREWVADVCAGLKKIGILWGCQTRAGLTNKSILSIMKDSGCIQIDCGWESGSEKMLKIMNKQAKPEDYIRFSNDCKDVGIRVLANMMINLPGETLSDISESIELIKKTEPNVTLWGEYIPIPGVKFGREMTVADLNTFSTNRSIIEDKYKFAVYGETLKSVLDKITTIFPNPRKPHLIIKWSYVKRWIRYFSYIFDGKYLSTLLHSRRKRQYLSIRRLLKQRKMR